MEETERGSENKAKKGREEGREEERDGGRTRRMQIGKRLEKHTERNYSLVKCHLIITQPA